MSVSAIFRGNFSERLVDAHAAVDEAVASGARGFMVVTFYDDDTFGEKVFGDVSLADLSVHSVRIHYIVGEFFTK